MIASTGPSGTSDHQNTEDATKKRIAWHTRRGIKEVEMLLIPFFEYQYSSLHDQQQVLFQELLTYPDTDLFNWLLHNEPAPTHPLQQLIDDIRTWQKN